MNILITAGLSAKSFKLVNLLNEHSIFLADYGELPSMNLPNVLFKSLGDRNEETLAHTLLSACLDLNAEVCVPLWDNEIKSCRAAKILFEEFGIQLVVPDVDLQEIDSIEISAANEVVVLLNGRDIVTKQSHHSYKNYSGVYYQPSGSLKTQIYKAG